MTLCPHGLVLLTGQDPVAHDRVLRAVRAVYARQGLRVECVSSSQEAGQKAFGDTVPAIGARSFLQTLAGQPWLRAHLVALRVATRDLSRHASLVEALKHAETAYRDSRRGRPLDDRTVLLVHDTGRIPAADLAALLARARSGGSKVVLADCPAHLEPTLSADLFRRLSGRYPTEVVGQGPAPVERPSNTPPPARHKVQKPELGLEQ